MTRPSVTRAYLVLTVDARENFLGEDVQARIYSEYPLSQIDGKNMVQILIATADGRDWEEARRNLRNKIIGSGRIGRARRGTT